MNIKFSDTASIKLVEMWNLFHLSRSCFWLLMIADTCYLCSYVLDLILSCYQPRYGSVCRSSPVLPLGFCLTAVLRCEWGALCWCVHSSDEFGCWEVLLLSKIPEFPKSLSNAMGVSYNGKSMMQSKAWLMGRQRSLEVGNNVICDRFFSFFANPSSRIMCLYFFFACSRIAGAWNECNFI